MKVTGQDIDGLVSWTVIRAAHRMERLLAELFAGFGLSPVQFGVLSYLATEAPFTQAALARAVLVRPQSIAGVLDNLVERGLVARQSGRARGRRNPLSLTPEGRLLLERVWPALRSANEPRRWGMDDSDAGELNRILLGTLSEDQTSEQRE